MLMLVVIGVFSIVLIIVGFYYETFSAILMGAMSLCFAIWLIINFKTLSGENNQFIEVQRVDNKKYIQCIENQQYLVSQIKGGNFTTVMLNASGKPIPCIERIYTSDQKNLPENKNKMFITK
ncbi:MAG: hypothetical protein K2Y14_01245 [Burkholderiales bacterium]|nr:hypothetical protein [Burkholderiales bacterium]